jgi:DnaK suppressor protein
VPKKKSLTKTQLAKISSMLQERQARLLGGGHRRPVGLDEDQDRGGDEVDVATLSQHHEMNLDARVRESRELQLIGRALAKIQDGSYGICEECEEPIAIARLEALPFAQYCIDCQERLDEQGVSTDPYEAPDLE